MDAKKRYEDWLENPYFDENTKNELRRIADDEKEIEERFYKELEFGTGGLRGIIGAGTNRMNIYTVRKATQGLANFILKENAEKKGVAVAFDSRNMSLEFAQEAALCLAANGIKAYVFSSLRPTPMLSFALRTLGCTAGIVITASHNPPEYNGYKVYWEDGAQITYPKDVQIIEEVNAVTDYAGAKTMSRKEAEAAGLYQVIGDEIDDQYMKALKSLVIHPEIIREEAQNLKIVYTPLHGTGNIPVRRILKELGFENVYVVKEQELPDGDFPTVSYPNPEDKNAFCLALKLAKEKDADIVLATDPDADRLGVYAKNAKTGEYQSFTGNMSGMLILEYILSQRKKQEALPENGAVVTTIVSGKMSKEIAKDYGMTLIETLTGFKYIGEQIKFFEQKKDHEYVFGYEESYGCLVGTHARDKDAVAAVMALCEVAAYCRHQGITLCDQMENLFQKYGYYQEGLCTVTLKGQEGAKKIQSMMEQIRENIPEKVGGLKVMRFRDYREDIVKDCVTGVQTVTGLPKSNVLYFELENEAWCCIRPSGTEPKIKFYIGVKGTSDADAAEKAKGVDKGSGVTGRVNVSGREIEKQRAQEELHMGFSDNFVWGAATSAYQIEGGVKGAGKGMHIWDVYTKESGKVYGGHTGETACDHYHRFREDVRIMKEIGLKAYRFSIDWTRVLPEGTGRVNEEGIRFYSDLIDALIENNIEPYITLYHWELPYELYKKGGWMNRDIAEWFGEYAGLVAERFSDRVTHFFTLNEPQCFVGLGFLTGVHAPGLKCPVRDTFEMAHNALRAHGRAVQMLRQHAKQPLTIGYAPTSGIIYPASDRPEDIEAARKKYFSMPEDDSNWTWNVAWWSDPVLLGKYPEEGLKKYEKYLPKITEEDMRLISEPIDVYGQNIYNGRAFRMGADGNPEEVGRVPGAGKTAVNWPVTPECLYWGPKFLYERYKKPIYITENGMACHDVVSLDQRVHDPNRIDFLARYLHELKRAAEEIDLRGYFQWSLMDNFEWEKGYAERFGIVYVDFETQERILKDSAYWYRDVIQTNGRDL